LTLVDRDIVELTNLQRQTLFDEKDASEGAPKAVAAARRLVAINSSVGVTPIISDLHSLNIEAMLPVDAIVDGTDNVQTRYLMNDVAVKHAVPWVYGAAVGVEGRVMGVRPGRSPCLRCVFPTPPSPQELATCDTAGVLGMAAAIVGAWEAIEAIKLLVDEHAEPTLLGLDFWRPRVHVTSLVGAKIEDCVCCGRRRFEFLDAPPGDAIVTLCGRNTVQVRPSGRTWIDLDELAIRLSAVGVTDRTPYLLKCELRDPAGVTLMVFADGRSLVQGVSDAKRAKAVVARFVGS
jgi:adenylyltransferase/sulfurtransferase